LCNSEGFTAVEKYTSKFRNIYVVSVPGTFFATPDLVVNSVFKMEDRIATHKILLISAYYKLYRSLPPPQAVQPAVNLGFQQNSPFLPVPGLPF
jgi:hypothetical protein